MGGPTDFAHDVGLKHYGSIIYVRISEIDRPNIIGVLR